MTATAKVHLERNGRARCGQGSWLSADVEAVTCATCRNITSGTHGHGNRQPDNDWCGTAARYRWHLRHEGKPVRCQPCLQAERIRDDRARDAYNARRRQRYAEARAAGMTSRQANARKNLRRAA